MNKLGLVFPRFRYPSGDYPLGIAMIAAMVERELGWRVVVCDTTFDPRLERIGAFLDRERPDVVGVAMSTLMLGEGLAAARMAKERGLPVFVGGPHPTIDPAGIMERPYVDACVLGEGEESTVELLRMFAAGERRAIAGCHVRTPTGVVAGPPRVFTKDLDELPFPAWHTIDMAAYIAAWGQLDAFRPGLRGVNLNASRGCPFECTFCQPVLDDMFGKKLRRRSPRSIVGEIAALHARYGIEGFWFTDDTFTVHRRWVRDFCDELDASGLKLVWGCTTRANLVAPELMARMAQSGLRRIGIGMESATDRIREGVYKKGVALEHVEHTVRVARDNGVSTLLFLMLGAPGETRREMVDTIEAATRLPADEASFSLFVPIPGTAVHADMVAAGYRLSNDYTDYDYYARQPFEGEISRRELRLLQRWAYLRFYGHPRRWRQLGRLAVDPKGLRSMGRKLLRILPHGAPAVAEPARSGGDSKVG